MIAFGLMNKWAPLKRVASLPRGLRNFAPISALCNLVVWIIRGTPLMLQVMIVFYLPGLAFDPAGHRIGYGGGFYDKFLSSEPGHPTVALCYEFQVFPQLETEEFDIPVDLVIY